MTISFKTFSKHLTEKASANVSVFDGSVADKGRIFSAGDLASFGTAGWGGINSNPKDNPMYKYFATNISNANTQTKSTLNLLRATPGLMSDVLGDGDGSLEDDENETGGLPSFILPGDEGQEGELGGDASGGGYSGMTTSSIRGSSGFGDGEDEDDTDDEEDDEDDEEDDEELNQIPGMNTDALYFGDPGDDETKKNIYRAALAHQKDAQARWKQLKTWVTSFGVDPKIQSKITSTTTVLGVNTPSIMKNLKKGKE
jgi:hypothetical protein